MNNVSLKILFASSEVFPFAKTGGLADVSSGLPLALDHLGHDVRVIMPAYKSIVDNAKKYDIRLNTIKPFSGRLLEGHLPRSKVKIWFVDLPELFYRNGGPYLATNGIDWPDNAERFNTFAKVVTQISNDAFGLNWKPDLVHSNDWQTALVPAYLSQQESRPATVFTIHNMAYLGLFPLDTIELLDMPQEWNTWEQLEFHKQLSFMKGGLVFSDQINTVSPTYAKQICTAKYAYGLEGLLQHRKNALSGILNGVNYAQWNPNKDTHIVKNYSLKTLENKSENKTALQNEFGLPQNIDTPLIGLIGRMVEQKGFDLLIDVLPSVLQKNVQFVVLGSGDANLENQFIQIANAYPEKISVKVGFDESLSHLIEAGADMFLMPSRFEPCGLNQFYSLKYGTIPLVSSTGGLADSVENITSNSILNKTATGFTFADSSTIELENAIHSALQTYQNKDLWNALMTNAMKMDFSWSKSAQNYTNLYHKAIQSQELQKAN